jgi:3-oxoacyl-[acyl-carrier-protein] synthase II
MMGLSNGDAPQKERLSLRRVVVTGMGAVCPLGEDWKTVSEGMRSGRSGVGVVPELGEYEGMSTRLAARVHGFEVPSTWPRKSLRSMGRVAQLAARATELALDEAGLRDAEIIGDGSTGVSYGSTHGSASATETYASQMYAKKTLKGIRAVDYPRLMSHTVPANLAQFFGVRGRVIPTCSACTSGSQGIGYGFDAIRFGQQELMLTGGAEEYHPIDSGVFDIMFATSTRNDAPETTPRPFDADRDGLVVGEGAGTLVLEELEHARGRGARILAEVVGYGTNCDGRHITNPDQQGMRKVMELALADAGLGPDDIDYVNAHGTATEAGDLAESNATHEVFGSRIPISTFKGHLGHTLGACGAIEAWLTLGMLAEGWFAPTLNLENVDPRCGDLDYVMGRPRKIEAEHVMSNNFAFGGVNTSLVFRRWSE